MSQNENVCNSTPPHQNVKTLMLSEKSKTIMLLDYYYYFGKRYYDLRPYKTIT